MLECAFLVYGWALGSKGANYFQLPLAVPALCAKSLDSDDASIQHPPPPPPGPLRHPKYHLIETIRPLIVVHSGVWDGIAVYT